jgi:hypothetical protein
MNRITSTKRSLRYTFTDEEKLSMAKESAEINKSIALLEDDKKSAMSSFKSQIDEKEARRMRLSNCISDGTEFRDIDCEIKYNSPSDGVKQVVRKDTGEVVEAEPMTQQELQEELEFKEKQELEAEEKRKAEADAAGKAKSERRRTSRKKK